MSKKDSTLWGGCDPALLKSESEALPPPHETIPIDGPETTCRCHCDHTPQSSHLAEWSNQVFPAQAYLALFHIPFFSDCHSPATAIQFHKLSRIAIADLERAIAAVFRPAEAKRFQLADSDLHDGAANTVVPTSNQGLNEASCQQAATPISSLLWQRHNPFIDACPKLTPSTPSLGINESHVDDSPQLRHL
jgi:hypothetical protein